MDYCRLGWLRRRSMKRWAVLSLAVVALLAATAYTYRPLNGMWTNPLCAMTGRDTYIEFAGGVVTCYSIRLEWTNPMPSDFSRCGAYRREGRDWVLTFPCGSSYPHKGPSVFRTKGGWLSFCIEDEYCEPNTLLYFHRVLNPLKIRAIKRKCGAAG